MTPKSAAARWFSAAKPEVDWDAAYAELLPRVYNFFIYRVDDAALAEDLTATTFERAWQGRSRYRHELSAFQTWLFGIARHVAADHFRQPRRDVALSHATKHADDQVVEETVERQGEVEKLLALLERLSDRDREIIALKYGADLSNVEIARVLKLSETNVSTLIYRIVGKLREEWETDDTTG